jgi:protein SPIRAL1 and related proteins
MTGRSSTRLHAPPGGSSQAGSLIFGGGDTSVDRFGGRGRRSNPVASNTYASTQHTTQHQQSSFTNKEQYNGQNQTQTTAPVAKKSGSGTSANAFASGTNQNCGNFITDRPTSRVLAPPGGKSSGPLW